MNYSVRPYDPWRSLSRLQGEMNRLFERRVPGSDDEDVVTDWVPAVDVKEEEAHYVIYADVPGVEPEDIEVEMENGVLTIRGERNSETREEQEGYKRVERVRGAFFRRFALPDTADAERISASSKAGVLRIVVPKQEKLQPRRISVEH